MLFEHINILTGLGFPFAHTDVIHTAHVYLKTKFKHAFKTSRNLHPFHTLFLKIFNIFFFSLEFADKK